MGALGVMGEMAPLNTTMIESRVVNLKFGKSASLLWYLFFILLLNQNNSFSCNPRSLSKKENLDTEQKRELFSVDTGELQVY